MIRAYKLDPELQEIFEDIRMYRADVETIEGQDHVTILRDEYERYVRERLDLLGMGYREIVREGTTTFVFLLGERGSEELEEVKLTLRFRDELYYNLEFKNFTFDRDLEFYLEQIAEEEREDDVVVPEDGSRDGIESIDDENGGDSEVRGDELGKK